MSAVTIGIDSLWEMVETASLPKEQRVLVKAARRYLVEASQLELQAAAKRKEIDRKRELVTRHRATLEAIPQIEGSSKKVDEILGLVLKLEREIERFEGQVEALEARIAERNRTARATLARI
jgi:peptidoglycan hydrolase CwlO-like protein